MKKILSAILCILLIGLTGCKSNKQTVSSDELNKINNQIIEYFNKNDANYDNFSFNYVDNENKVVVVGLLENSKNEQEEFKKRVVNSNLIKFVEGDKNINH